MTEPMTALATIPEGSNVAALPPRRSYTARVLLDTIGPIGARLGLLWIGALAFLAVFAPFLASSHPLLMKTAEGLSSPLLRHLTPTDVVLLVITLAALVLIAPWTRLRIRVRALALLAILAIAIPVAIWLVRPPKIIVYDRYRTGLTDRSIQWAIHTVIPFSATDRLRDMPDLKHPLPPGPDHWLGTDRNGADMASRMIHACRIALAVGFIATSIAMVIGVTLGGLMGYFSGIIDLLGMRLVEIFSAIPTLYLLLTFVAFFPRNIYLMMVIIGLTGWVGYAIFIRAEFLKLRQQDFVQAARACGLPLWSILFRHMLPNGIAPVLVSASFGVASAILAESTLSFLGLGLIDEPSWGQMLSQATSAGGGFYWWIAFFPGAAIFLTVFAYNLVGESLRDAIDPHLKKASQL